MAQDTGSSENLNQSYDAQQMAEDIEKGEQKKPNVNVDADYEAAKKYSGSDSVEATGGSQSAATGTPEEFRKIARELKS